MSIKIKSTQIYEDHKEEFEEVHEKYGIKLLDKSIVINYNNGNEIIFDKEKNIIEIKRPENNIFVELNKEKEFIYETPYGRINLKTYGEKIIIEENPFKMLLEYKISFNNTAEYKNVIEILEL